MKDKINMMKHICEVARDFRLKQVDNYDHLVRFNESINYLKRMKDITSYQHVFMKKMDKTMNNYIQSIKSIPDNHVMKNLIKDSCIKYYEISVRYYNPRVNGMMEFIPMMELDPIMRYKYFYMRELLRLKNISSFNLSELYKHRKLWDIFHRATKGLEESLKKKMTQFEQITGQISCEVTQTLVHVVTCQSYDGIQYVYGNIFALVKLGFYTTVWYNFTECDSYFYDMVPEEFLDLFFKDESYVPGYTKFQFLETQDDMIPSIDEAFEDSPFKDMLDAMRKEQDELEEWFRLPDGDTIIGSVRANKSMYESKWLAGISLGVLVCFCVSVGVLPDWNSIL